MQRFPRAVATAGLAVLLLAGCGSTAEPEAADLTPTETATTPAPTESASPTEGDAVAETVEVTAAPPPQAEAGLFLPDVMVDVPRAVGTPVTAGTFGVPAGTFEIHSVDTADTVPGALVPGGTEPTYTAADGEEFYVFDINFVRGEDDQPPAAELHLESQGTTRLVTELTQGESTFVASLPSGAEGARLLVSSDGHEQVFDIAAGERIADPLTDVYLRPVTQQDLTELLTYGPMAAGTKGRTYSGDIRMRSARITPYVPPRIGPQRWAEPGTMWLILDFEADYTSNDTGWKKVNATLSWSVEGAGTAVQEGRLWSPSTDPVVLNIPADAESIQVEVANRFEGSSFGDEGIADFGSQSFTLNFPDEG